MFKNKPCQGLISAGFFGPGYLLIQRLKNAKTAIIIPPLVFSFQIETYFNNYDKYSNIRRLKKFSLMTASTQR